MKRFLTIAFFALTFAVISSTSTSLAQDKWATLKAKFVLNGKAPTPQKIDGSKDAICAPFNMLSEALVVDKEGNIQNMAIYMDKRSKVQDVHPDLKTPKEPTVTLDNIKCVFKPHVLFVRTGQTINVTNSDQTGHNANFSFFNNTPENFLIPAGGSKTKKVEAEEPAPIPVECNVHPWMKAHIIVTEHPYVGISGSDGVIEIANLPVGEVTFKVWHESSEGSIDAATVNGKAEKWSRGKMEITLKPGMNDLGTIKIDASKFKAL